MSRGFITRIYKTTNVVLLIEWKKTRR
jgi:hypothetical protein